MNYSLIRSGEKTVERILAHWLIRVVFELIVLNVLEMFYSIDDMNIFIGTELFDNNKKIVLVFIGYFIWVIIIIQRLLQYRISIETYSFAKLNGEAI